MNDHVDYITSIIDGLESATPDSTKEEYYQKYLAFIKAKNDRNAKYKLLAKRPVTLEFYKEKYFRSVIINMLLDSSYAHYFEDLTYKDITQILGGSYDRSYIPQLERHCKRLLARVEHRAAFNAIQDTISLMKEEQ